MTRTGEGSQTLAERLCDRIRRGGPMTFRDWMEAALYDEHQGYYLRGDRVRWGRHGDYRTSPETSTLFAATFARYFAQVFEKAGSPAAFTIVEVGGGAGDFAAELLDSLRQRFPKVFESTTYILDEISPDARARAAKKVEIYREHVQFRRLFELSTIDVGIVFSNELLDAFPVHRVTLRSGKLWERYVDAVADNCFKWINGPLSTTRLLAHLQRFDIEPREGQVIEINLGLEDWFQQVNGKLNRGYVITVDYGAEAVELYGSPLRPAGTLRAFQRHEFASDVLNKPGEQDITSTVDWTAAKKIGEELGFKNCRLEPQDHFLLAGGLLEELELRVGKIKSEAERMRLRAGVREMILPNGIAGSFQVLIQSKGIGC